MAGESRNLPVSIKDDTPFYPASDDVNPAGFLFDDTSTDTVDEDDVGAARMSSSRVLYANPTGATGTALFPAAAAAADAETNPTETRIAADTRGFNGTTWDRLRAGAVANVAAATGYLDALAVALYNATLPTITDTRYEALHLGSRGSLQTNLLSTNGTVGAVVNTGGAVSMSLDQLAGTAVTGGADVSADGYGVGVGANYQRILNFNYLFNGTTMDRLRGGFASDGQGATGLLWAHPTLFNNTTYDRMRGNIDGTALASAARTVATNSADLTNYNGNTVDVFIDVTAWTAGSITVTIQGKDVLSGKYYTILAGTAIGSATTQILRVGPGILSAANASAQYALPRTWRVSVAVGTADSITYSIGFSTTVA